MEKPSCINELKRIASSLTISDIDAVECITRVKDIINDSKLTDIEKISKLKDLCEDHGNRPK
jgi:hypothetical protein